MRLNSPGWKQVPNLYKLVAISAFLLILIVTVFQPQARDRWREMKDAAMGPAAESPIAGGMPLRVMFVGASMTLGEHSTGQRGYRKQIRDWLVGLGNPVNCVGQNRFGDFKDNDVQAFGAQPIKPTLDRAREIVPQTQPNLILINAGSSDCFQLQHWGPAYILQSMRELVDFLLEASPRATIILSTIITSPWPGTERCVRSANAQIRQVAIDLEREGKPVALAEMHYDQGFPNRTLLSDIGRDEMHPTDQGYFKMGFVFMEKIREVEKKGFLQPPVDNGILLDGDTERDAEAARKKEEEERKTKEKTKGEGDKPGQKRHILEKASHQRHRPG